MPLANLRRPGNNLGRARLLLAVAALVVAGGCGSSEGFDDDEGPPISDGPRVADPRFDGNFEITDVEVGGTRVTVEQRPSIEIEAEFGGLAVLPGCNTYFGSFTLDEGGRASFTVTGGTEQDCGDLARQEREILDALGAVDQWLPTDDGFRFEGSGASLVVVGPAG